MGMTNQELFAVFPTIDDLMLNRSNKEALRVFRRIAGGRPRNITLYGKPGAGKSTLAYLLTRWSYQSQGNAAQEPQILDCSGGHNLATLKKPQTSWAQWHGLKNEWFILDDVEGISPLSRQKALRGIINNDYAFPRHFILTTNDLAKVDEAVLDRCEPFEIVAPTPDEYLPFARKQLLAGGIQFNEALVLNYLKAKMNGSLRTAERNIDDLIAYIEDGDTD